MNENNKNEIIELKEENQKPKHSMAKKRIVVFLIYIFSPALFLVPMMIMGFGTDIMSQLVIVTIAVALCIIVYCKMGKTTFKDFLRDIGFFTFNIKLFFKAVGIGILLIGLSVGITSVLPSEQNYTTSAVIDFIERSFIVTFLMAGILIPIQEEVFFRGLLDKLNIHYVFVAIFFAILHLDLNNIFAITTIPMFLTTFIAAFTFGFCYKRYKTIWFPIVSHIVFNSIIITAATMV